jgi:hypothetical protein
VFLLSGRNIIERYERSQIRVECAPVVIPGYSFWLFAVVQCRGTNVMRASCYPRLMTSPRAEAGVRVYQQLLIYPGAESPAKTVTSLLIIPSVLWLVFFIFQ